MDREQFTATAPGQLLQTLDGHLAFVPSPLPPDVNVPLRLFRHVSDADHALGKVAGLARILPNPHLLTQPLLRREAVLSSRIEGTEASITDLAVFEAAGAPETESGDVTEVANYVTALEFGLRRLETLPLSLRFIREVHAKLMAGVRGGSRAPGEFRHVQNWIGHGGSKITRATYVPPPVQEMHRALDAFEKFLHAPSDLPPLIRFAMIHYQFEAIHPFLDGNGRVGRLLIAFLMHVEKRMDEPLLYLSAFFERHRAEYYRRLLDVTTNGAWLDWIEFFLNGVIEQSNDAVRRTGSILDLVAEYRRRIARQRNAGPLGLFIDNLFAVPATTIRAAAERLEMSYPAAKKNIDKLVDMQILTPRKSGRGFVYVADEIIRIVEE